MVPFAFRLLLAELPQHLGKQHETLDRLYTLLAKVREVLQNLSAGKAEDGQMSKMSADDHMAATELWQLREQRILYSLANCAILQKDFDMAVDNIETLLSLSQSDERKAKLLSALGRLYLQLGKSLVNISLWLIELDTLTHSQSLIEHNIKHFLLWYSIYLIFYRNILRDFFLH